MIDESPTPAPTHIHKDSANIFAGNTRRAIYGLHHPRDSWLIDQLDGFVNAGAQLVEGISIELLGVGEGFQPIIEIHGKLNPRQLRLLADAIENVPV